MLIHAYQASPPTIFTDYRVFTIALPALSNQPTDSATMLRSLLTSLHCLPIRQRVTFKLAGLVYRSLHETSPNYLSSVLHA